MFICFLSKLTRNIQICNYAEEITSLTIQNNKVLVIQNKDFNTINKNICSKKNLEDCVILHCNLRDKQLKSIIKTLTKRKNNINIFIRANNRKLSTHLSTPNNITVKISDDNNIVITKNILNMFVNGNLLGQFKKLSVDSIEFYQLIFSNIFSTDNNSDKFFKIILDNNNPNSWLYEPKLIFNQCKIHKFKEFKERITYITKEKRTIPVEYIDTIGVPKGENRSLKNVRQSQTLTINNLDNNLLEKYNQDLSIIHYKEVMFNNINFKKNITDTIKNRELLMNILLQAKKLVFDNCCLDKKVAIALKNIITHHNKTKILFNKCEADDNEVYKQLLEIKTLQRKALMGDNNGPLGGPLGSVINQMFSQANIPTGASMSNPENSENQKYIKKIANMDSNDVHKRKEKTQELFNKYQSAHAQDPNKSTLQKKLDALVSLPQLTWKAVKFSQIKDGFLLVEILKKNIKAILDEYIVGNRMLKDKIITIIINGLKVGEFKWIVLVGPPGIGKTSFLFGLAAVFAYIEDWYREVIVNNNTNMALKEITKNKDSSLFKQLETTKEHYLGWIKMSSVTSKEQIEGHKEVYTGAAPGMLFQALCKDSTDNVNRQFRVVGIDELDKSQKDSKGDIVSHVFLDKADSNGTSYSDKYIGENFKFNLKKVFVVATANEISSIPATLQDRMERIQVSGYSQEEKVRIIMEKTIPQALSKLEANSDYVELTKDAAEKIVQISGNNTKLSIRELQADVQSILSNAVNEYFKLQPRKKIIITPENLESYLPDNTNNFLEQDYFIGSELGMVNIFIMDNEGQLTPARITAAKVSKEYASSYSQYEILNIRDNDKAYGSQDLKGLIQNKLATAIPTAIEKSNKLLSILSVLKQNHITVEMHGKSSVKSEEEGFISVGIALAVLSLLTEQPLRQDVYCYGSMDNRGQITFGGKVDFATRIKNAINTLQKYRANSKLTVLFSRFHTGKNDEMLKADIIKVLKNENININQIEIKFVNNIIEAYECAKVTNQKINNNQINSLI